jgi:hypothetical protein
MEFNSGFKGLINWHLTLGIHITQHDAQNAERQVKALAI